MRNFVILGMAVAASVAIPMAYQSDPKAFHRLLAPSEEAATEAAEPAPTLKVVATPVPAAPEVLLGRKVKVSADERGHFVADFKLNGRAVEALVDTGATTVAINRSTARRIGISLDRDDFKYEVRTANGVTRAAGIVIERIQIGRIMVEDVQAAVLEDTALDGTLVGMSFLNRLSKFHVENGALLLVQ
ncbi:TIGR02281 family clan AA aspartic protease [Mesorhizobium sp. ZC-5]|uniref:TIGR02281 family clan AA aspartic protease n=1 Tax=Mesorhizobium sp. ZC-5 TaxID=2986066 RepID=UPI0029813243|nr:TIGR02281 family clan AA aspartic protease [Mesorhizobium sp. ZC-5]